MLAVLLPAMFSGCFGEDGAGNILDEEEAAYLQPWERAGEIYDDSDVFSRVTVNGSFGIDTVRSVYVDVPTITAAAAIGTKAWVLVVTNFYRVFLLKYLDYKLIKDE